MSTSVSPRRFALTLALAALGLAASAPAARAGDFEASGTTTFVGRHGAFFELAITGGHAKPGGKFTGTVSGKRLADSNIQTAVIVMDFGGGDTLTFDTVIVWNDETDAYDGVYVVTGGTGALAGASGSGALFADPAGGTFEMDGTLSF